MTGETRRDKLREQCKGLIEILKKAAEGKVSDYEFCPIVNQDLPEEMCRGPKRMMGCPTDAFCCKDCPEFEKGCDAVCRVAVELTKGAEAKTS